MLTCVACASPEASNGPSALEPDDDPRGVLPVDTTLVLSPKEAALWEYRRTVDADLNADGKAERLVLAADVAVNEGGQPLWEDGHRWVVYVEEDSSRTLLYASLVQLGNVEATVTELEGALHVTIYERGPYRRQAWEVEYDGYGAVQLVGRAGGMVWDPRSGILEPSL